VPNSINILSIDLEEWYHPEYVRHKAPFEKEEHITKSLNKTLDLLQEYHINATYFILGELAEKHPEIVEQITEKEHEIAFHGHDHEPLFKKNADLLKQEIEGFRSVSNGKCIGFRAPSFSLSNKTKWALKVLDDAGYKYDSSVFPTKAPLYGVRGAPTSPYRPSMNDLTKENNKSGLWEFPLLVYALAGLRIPVAGGFYLRLLPTSIVKRAIKKLNKQGSPAVIFFHNWEIDPETPKMKIGHYKSFVTYHNIEEMEERLRNLLSVFKFTSFRDYMEDHRLLH
jgi:polysaccharide deacetylase family protein (PEP-CTERM system associated)